MRPIRTWVVVADGARARFLQNLGPGKGLEPLPDGDLSQDLHSNGEIMADRPGRAFDRNGPGRHGMEPTVDHHEEEKAGFARRVSDVLSQAAARDRFDRLVLVAAPRTLGHLRRAISPAAARRIVSEVPKDLTGHGTGELAKLIGESLPH